MPEPQKYWQTKAAAGESGKQRVTLLFYGDISMYPNWYEEDKSALEIAAELKSYGEIEAIDVRINSPGGSVWGGLAIANLLRAWPAPVTTHVDGLAGSAASLIFAAGDTRIMAPNTLLFVHNVAQPIMWETFFAKDLRKLADDLDTISLAVVATYKEISSLSEDEITALMDNESFISAGQAKDWGFATEVGRQPVVNTLRAGKLLVDGQEVDLARRGITVTDELLAALDATANEDDGTADADADAAADANANADADADADADTTDATEDSARNTGDQEDANTPDPIATAVTAERARLQAIDALAAKAPGAETLAQKAKYEELMSAEAFAVAVLNSDQVRKSAMLQQRFNGSQAALVHGGAAPSDNATTNTSEQAALIADSMKKLRGE